MFDQASQAGKIPPSPRRLKALASSLERANPSLSHWDAVDAVVREKGWRSYKAYLRDWKDSRTKELSASRFEVTLSAHWSDHQTSGHGTEIARVSLSEPWWLFLTLEQRRHVVALSRFRIDGSDRSKLITKSNLASPTSALHYAQKAARALSFIDVLRVLPTSARAVIKDWDIDPYDWRFPAMDHELFWYVPETETYFLTNEPYQNELSRDSGAQEQWLESRGFSVVTLPNSSIHNPPYTILQLITKTGQMSQIEKFGKRCHLLANSFAAIETTTNC